MVYTNKGQNSLSKNEKDKEEIKSKNINKSKEHIVENLDAYFEEDKINKKDWKDLNKNNERKSDKYSEKNSKKSPKNSDKIEKNEKIGKIDKIKANKQKIPKNRNVDISKGKFNTFSTKKI